MIEIEELEGIAVLTMAHGPVNAMSLEFCERMVAALQGIEARVDVQGLVITAEGSVFSAGIDLKRVAAEPPAYLEQFLPALRRLFRTAFAFSKPLVAVVNGPALAGGCVLACAADYRIADPEARIGIPEMRIGVPLPTLGIEIMRFTATGPALRQIVTNGMTFQGEAAVTAGLVDQLAAEVDSRPAGLTAVRQFAMLPPAVFAHSKRQLRSEAWGRIERGTQEFEPEVDAMWRSEPIRAGICEYVERVL